MESLTERKYAQTPFFFDLCEFSEMDFKIAEYILRKAVLDYRTLGRMFLTKDFVGRELEHTYSSDVSHLKPEFQYIYRLFCAAGELLLRRSYKIPEGYVNEKGFWQPEFYELRNCCMSISFSKAYPDALLTHCLSFRHVAELYEVQKRHLAYLYRGIKKEGKEGNADKAKQVFDMLNPRRRDLR